eukprot:jgi/Tetstr1/423758/TSEL_014388.t1
MPRRSWRVPGGHLPEEDNSAVSQPPATTWAWGEPDDLRNPSPRPRPASAESWPEAAPSNPRLVRTSTGTYNPRARGGSAILTTAHLVPCPSRSGGQQREREQPQAVRSGGGLDRVRRQILGLAVDRLRGQPLRAVALQVAQRASASASAPPGALPDPATFAQFAELVERTFPASSPEEEEAGACPSGTRGGLRRRLTSGRRGGRQQPDNPRVDALLDVFLAGTPGGDLDALISGASPALPLALLTCALGYDAALPSVSRRLSVNYPVALPLAGNNKPAAADDLPGLKLLFKLVESSGLVTHFKPLEQEVFRLTVTKLLRSVGRDAASTGLSGAFANALSAR